MAITNDGKDNDKEAAALAEKGKREREQADAKKRAAERQSSLMAAPQEIAKLLAPFDDGEKIRILQSLRLLLNLQGPPRQQTAPAQRRG